MALKISFRSYHCIGCGGPPLAVWRSGSVVGLIPAVLGVGYGVIDELLLGHNVGGLLLSLLLLKALVWAIALGSGTSGGCWRRC